MKYFFIFSMLILSSYESKFDAEKWKYNGVDWQILDVREKMVDDIIDSDTLIGLIKQEILHLLSDPDFQDSLKVQYLIREKYGLNIDPAYIFYLNVFINPKENTVDSCNMLVYD